MDHEPTHIVMVGTDPTTRGGISSVVNAWRTTGLFERWPVEYVTSHRSGGWDTARSAPRHSHRISSSILYTTLCRVLVRPFCANTGICPLGFRSWLADAMGSGYLPGWLPGRLCGRAKQKPIRTSTAVRFSSLIGFISLRPG